MAYNSEPNPALSRRSTDTDENMPFIKELHPISDLNESNRKVLSKSSSIMHLQRNDQLKLDTIFRSLVYVIEGSVTIFSGKSEVSTITAGSKEAKQPLTIDQTANQMIKTRTIAKLVRFSREQMDILLKEQEKTATHVLERQVSATDNLVFDEIIKDMKQNSVSLCSFTETAQKIMKSVQAKSLDIPDLARIIQSDPGLTAHIILAASRADGANKDPVQTIRGAITRLGVEPTIRMAMELPAQNALKSDNPIINEHLRKYQQRATLAAAISQVLAHKVPHLKPDMALLAGLTADIGELMAVSYAAKFQDHFKLPKQLNDTVGNLREFVGSWLLSSWGFSAEFVDATHTSRDWYRNQSGDIQYSDLVTAALLTIQKELPDGEISSIPDANSLLITRRLQQAGIDLNASREILQSAGQNLTNLQTLLKAG